jgi:hypothetical protein
MYENTQFTRDPNDDAAVVDFGPDADDADNPPWLSYGSLLSSCPTSDWETRSPMDFSRSLIRVPISSTVLEAKERGGNEGKKNKKKKKTREEQVNEGAKKGMEGDGRE